MFTGYVDKNMMYAVTTEKSSDCQASYYLVFSTDRIPAATI